MDEDDFIEPWTGRSDSRMQEAWAWGGGGGVGWNGMPPLPASGVLEVRMERWREATEEEGSV